MINLNDNNFLKFNIKNKFILINFYSDLCVPCKKMFIIYKKIFNNNKNNLILFSIVDIEKNPKLVDKFFIKSIPTFIFIYNNLVINKKIGTFDEKEFKNFINISVKKN